MTTFRDYLLHGWKLCSIAPGTKGPTFKGWNMRERAISDPGVGPQLAGAGLCHAWSGTCALDVDNMDVARAYLLERGIDLDALLLAPDSVQIHSGKPGRAKLLYRLATPLASLKLASYQVPNPQIPGKMKTFHGFELRCATAEGLTVQDVLPPTIHPETCRPYEWRYGDELCGDWQTLPPLPENLETVWRENLKPVVERGPQAAIGVELEHIVKLLESQDPDADHDQWLAVGMAIHHETGGSHEGFTIWDQWSAKGSKYPGAAALEPRWRSFHSDAENAVTLAKLLREQTVSVGDFPAPQAVAAGLSGEDEGRALVEGSAGTDTRPDAVMQRLVGDHVVYVRKLDLYFDKRDQLIYESDSALRHAFVPDIPQFTLDTKKGPVLYTIDPVQWLMKSKTRRDNDVFGLAMHPGEGIIFEERGRRFANTYHPGTRPCAINPATQAVRPKPHEREAFEFLWSRIASPVFAAWLKKFYAYALKHPGRKIRSAPLLVSQTTGTGKSTLMNMVPRLLFGHIEQLTEAQVRSTFNGELMYTWWATVEEICAGSTKSERRYIADKMKPWITNDDIPINEKGKTPVSIVNRLQITASSNHLDALQLEDDEERRWGVCGVKEDQWTEGQALGVYTDFLLKPHAPSVLKWIFQHENLTGFNPDAKPPLTRMKQVMVAAGLGSWEAILIQRILAGEPPFDRDLFTLRDVQEQIVGLNGATPHKIGAILRARPFMCSPILSGQRTQRMWAWRNAALWSRTSELERLTYMATGARPTGYAWQTDIPEALQAMDADGDAPEESACDLV